jgi:MATE family multidrug resistance protein
LEVRRCIQLGGPLAIGELGWMSTYIVDALVIGRLHNSALAIGASGIGNTIYYGVVFFAIYLLNGLETIVSQAAGRGNRDECVRITAQSMWIVLLGTPAVMLLTMTAVHSLPMFGVSRELTDETIRYTRVLVWSTFPLMLYMALRRLLQSINRVAFISISLVTAGAANLLCDWLLVFGHWHLPALGLAGSGAATILVRLWMLAILMVGTLIALKQINVRPTVAMLRPDALRLKSLLQIGWPSGLQFSLELGISTFTTVLCAKLSTLAVASQQVALDLNAFVYMIPAGMSYAAMIRGGQAAGRNDITSVKRATNATLFATLSFTALTSALFLSIPHRLASLYTNDPHVVLAAVPLFHISALLVPMDALFVIQASAFTGLGDTRTPMWTSIVCNWVIGMPAAYYLGFPRGHGVLGLWVGRAIASFTSAGVLTFFWRRRIRLESTTAAPSLVTPILAHFAAR